MQPRFMINDVIFIRHVNATHINTDDLIAMYSPFGDKRILLRRIIEKDETSEGIMFRTKGDGYLDRDPWILHESQIIGLIIAYQRDNAVTVIFETASLYTSYGHKTNQNSSSTRCTTVGPPSLITIERPIN